MTNCTTVQVGEQITLTGLELLHIHYQRQAMNPPTDDWQDDSTEHQLIVAGRECLWYAPQQIIEDDMLMLMNRASRIKSVYSITLEALTLERFIYESEDPLTHESIPAHMISIPSWKFISLCTWRDMKDFALAQAELDAITTKHIAALNASE